MPLSPWVDSTLIPLCLSHLLKINFFPDELHCSQQRGEKGEASLSSLRPIWADIAPYFASSWKTTAI